MNLVTLLLVASLSGAQATPPTRLPNLYDFATLKTFRCDFTESEGRRMTQAGVTSPAKNETFRDLVIDSIDLTKHEARFIGNIGSETLQVVDGDAAISFIEITGSGNINVLSIFRNTGSRDAYFSSYSRHAAYSTGNLAISQSYGLCRGLL